MVIKTTETRLSYINLQGGWPTPRLHPVTDIEAASIDVLRSNGIHEKLLYGPVCGSPMVREGIGRWLGTVYSATGEPISTERILVTPGASTGLISILQKFTDPGYTRAVWLVEPVYFLASPSFKDAGFVGSIRGTPEGRDGVDVAALGSALQSVDDTHHDTKEPFKSPEHGYPKIYKHVIYMVASFSNPSGKTMTMENRRELIKLARKHDALIISDDVYDMLMWSVDPSADLNTLGPSPPRLVDVDRDLEGTTPFGNSVSNGSFSKIVAPGIRVGWLEGTPEFIKASSTVGPNYSGGCQAHFGSLIIGQMLANGSLSRHIKDVLIPTYRRRYNVMVSAIQEQLYPLGVSIVGHDDVVASGIAGGFFLYVSFKDCKGLQDGFEISKIALEEANLRIAPGSIFTVSPGYEKSATSAWYLQGARLCWAFNEDEILIEGITRLAEVLKRLKVTSEKKVA